MRGIEKLFNRPRPLVTIHMGNSLNKGPFKGAQNGTAPLYPKRDPKVDNYPGDQDAIKKNSPEPEAIRMHGWSSKAQGEVAGGSRSKIIGGLGFGIRVLGFRETLNPKLFIAR